MRLAFFIFHYFPFGGLERNFLAIARRCQERGHQIDVYTHDWRGEKPAGFTIYHIPCFGFTNHARLVSFSKRAKIQSQDQPYDCVIGFQRMPGLDLYYCADVCFRYQSAYQYGTWYRYTPRYKTYAQLEEAVFSPSSKTEILLLSQEQKKWYQQYYHTPDARFHFMPPGINRALAPPLNQADIRQSLRAEQGLSESDFILLFIGSDYHRKGLDRVLKSFAHLKKKHSHLWVIGEGDQKPFLRFIKQHGLTDQIHFLGAQHNVHPYLLSADVLIHPAYIENTGNVLLEALVAGLPVITTANCGYAFHIKNAQAGIVVDEPFSQRALDQALITTVDKMRRQQWQQQALTYSHQMDLYSRVDAAVNVIESFTIK